MYPAFLFTSMYSLVIVALLNTSVAFAQTYPNKPIKLVVPVAAGGGTDMVGRVIAGRLGKALGQSVIVENQGGSGGVIGAQMVARAKPDGYTLMVGYVATHGTNPATRKVPYDPIKDFAAIGMVGGTPNVLVVDANLPIKNLNDFLNYAKANSGKLSYGSAGQGTLSHLLMELFKQEAKIDVVHAPYKGIAPAITDVLGGQTQMMLPGLAASLSLIKAGKLRPIAITGERRNPLLPDVPTLIELGYQGFDAIQWYGIVAPANVPADIVKKLSETLYTIVREKDLADKLSGEAITPMPMTAQEFDAYIKLEISRWTQLAKAKNITAEQ